MSDGACCHYCRKYKCECEAGEVAKRTVKILSTVSYGCSCESYVHYQCALCRLISETEPLVFAQLCECGLIEHGKFAPYKLTQAGKYELNRNSHIMTEETNRERCR